MLTLNLVTALRSHFTRPLLVNFLAITQVEPTHLSEFFEGQVTVARQKGEGLSPDKTDPCREQEEAAAP